MKVNIKKFLLIVTVLITSILLFSDGYLGVYLSKPSEKEMKKSKLDNCGLRIDKVTSESPAEKGGLKQGDIIVELAGEKVYTQQQLEVMLENYKKGDAIKIKVKRDKRTKTKKIVLGSREDSQPKRSYIGVITGTLNTSETNYNHGIVLSTVLDDTPASTAGLVKGDILLELNSEKVYTSNQLTAMLKNHKPKDKITLKISRDKKEQNVDVVLGVSPLNTLTESFQFMTDKITDAIPGKTYMYSYNTSNTKVIGIKATTVSKNDEKPVMTITEVVEGGPAAKALIKVGDIILKVNGKEVTELDELIDETQKVDIGAKIKLLIKRDDKELEFEVEVGERESIFDSGVLDKSFFYDNVNLDDLKIIESIEAIDADGVQELINQITIELDGALKGLDEKLKKSEKQIKKGINKVH
ncbi:MAG: hypothetical protein B6226_01310 [Candidatus Cloacimonetes bacterium 4572_65]|nr:MAG: hypothetical protein B6226_01310 [Candidatus Cloacimonetes bacterium 4572_65]